MSDQPKLTVPKSLENQLDRYKQVVWKIKMIEAVAMAIVGVLLGFLFVFLLDRFFDTPAAIRVLAFLGAVVGCGMVPWFLHRWVWRHRRTEQLARLLSHKMPQLGDQLLGVIELTKNEAEQHRSLALCAAAVKQVAEESNKRDFRAATPPSRYRSWATAALVAAGGAVVLLVLFPAATSNAWARFLAPWKPTPRYTFTHLEPLPEQMVVAHGEPFDLQVQLAPSTQWHPDTASVTIGSQRPLDVEMVKESYSFTLPPLIEDSQLEVRVGDAVHRIDVQPKLRPELRSLMAEVSLPDYLQLPEPLEKDLRSGSVSLVKGSRATVSAAASRPLTEARVNEQPVATEGERFAASPARVDALVNLKLDWQDEFGLAGREPFALSIEAHDDEPPTVICEDLQRTSVILDSELLNFKIKASDDFGVRRVGIHWSSLDAAYVETPTEGSRALAGGSPDASSMEVQGTFSAKSLGIPAQPLQLRIWAEDYLPDRPPVYSAAYTVYVLTPDQHAIWMAEQLNKWHRKALEVRDRERQLFETNKEFRELDADQLDNPETRRQLARQAEAERANGRRLEKLTAAGEQLVRQAARNPEIGVGHLDRWAEMLQVLKDISGNRMPTVAELLKEAANQPKTVSSTPKPSGPAVGKVQATGSGQGSESEEEDTPKTPPAPSIADIESNQQPANEPAESESEPGKKKPSQPSLGLVKTTLIGPGGEPAEPPPPANENVDQAVEEQSDLLAEFEKIADELNQILGNLEGSTLVKRLKAASRHQYLIGGHLTDDLTDTFGREEVPDETETAAKLTELQEQEHQSARTVSLIMDDMQAYFERRRLTQFKMILDDMKEQDVIGSLRQLGTDLVAEQATSVAQCDYWSDAMDRWAEDLVDPASSGSCPGGKSPGSLPPSLVLEVLQVLEAEMNLREETRVAQQAREVVDAEKHEGEAKRLASEQNQLAGRIIEVIEAIEALPEGAQRFAKDLKLLDGVVPVMNDATDILRDGDTGMAAIAAETEVIERLLQSERINPKGGGGGGGSTPGGGGGGTTTDTAIVLMGTGINKNEVREDHGVSQATGESGPALPEEFRAGLDRYFNQLEQVQ
ncbi:hypothetical protein [Roseimaritima ulvae]|uniref:Uncharacterized protein n=1 Tax=Roseimaritima ulvae TaxID=980254 RepID=A0A5B9QX99_9BACT|nr:hypothetical protein [Roseimaritima ulvae]QEG38591.1 hypothetical protein UC8_05480 [Roseimaritima ulvae]